MTEQKGNGDCWLVKFDVLGNIEWLKSFGGTEGFMPEEGLGTPSADIFGLGRTLYQAASGCDPKRQPGLPTALAKRTDQREFIRLMDVIDKACASSIQSRYQSAEDLRNDLAKLESTLRRRQ